MNELDIIYHNASGKRCRMIINMEVFFPCAKTWLQKLIKLAINHSDAPDYYLTEIWSYLEDLQAAYEAKDPESITAKDRANIKKVRGCLDLLGLEGAQHEQFTTNN